jgi:exodeoxyribonuclease VII large subunit
VSQPAFDFGDEPGDDAGIPTFTVGELTGAINGVLRRGFGDGVWVRGEIQGWSERGPHAYFQLVEETDGGKAVLNVSFFANVRAKLRPLLAKHRLRLGDGMKVRIFGHLDVFAPTGRLGLKMSGLDPRFTLGDLALARDEVVRRLVASGLIDANRRHRLPPVPLRIGVVTSVGSAAWHDFHDELARSGFGFHLTVVDTRVQGEWAVSMVAAAITTLARRDDLDAIAVIRGGGARNELAVFDAEPIALAIATAPVPVLTGLGHEVDRSVADEVAHTAHKTPTACAASLVTEVARALQVAEQAWAATVAVAQRSTSEADGRVRRATERLSSLTRSSADRAAQTLGHRVERLHAVAPRQLAHAEREVGRLTGQLRERPARSVDALERALDGLAVRAAMLDPAVQLARGWSITRRADGSVVRSIDDVSPGGTLVTTLADGAVTSTVVGSVTSAAASPSPAEEHSA